MLQIIEIISADWVFKPFRHELAVFQHVLNCFGLLSASFRVCCFGVYGNLTTPILVNEYPRWKREECYLQVTSSEPNNLITCVELSWVSAGGGIWRVGWTESDESEWESSRIVEGDVPSEYRERQSEDTIKFKSHQRRRFEKRARSWAERRWCRNLKRKFRGTLGSRLA
jgi:hypothetical protein